MQGQSRPMESGPTAKIKKPTLEKAAMVAAAAAKFPAKIKTPRHSMLRPSSSRPLVLQAFRIADGRKAQFSPIINRSSVFAIARSSCMVILNFCAVG